MTSEPRSNVDSHIDKTLSRACRMTWVLCCELRWCLVPHPAVFRLRCLLALVSGCSSSSIIFYCSTPAGQCIRLPHSALRYLGSTSLLQGSEAAGKLLRCLAPVHTDSEDEQLSQIPVLTTLSDIDRQKFRAAFNDENNRDQSFLGWCMSNSVHMAQAVDNVSAAMQNMGMVGD